MIKCIDCPYYVSEEKGYPFCCLYLMALDNVAIYDLCKFIEKENKWVGKKKQLNIVWSANTITDYSVRDIEIGKTKKQ